MNDQPQQPVWGQQQPGTYAPPPPKKSSAGKIVAIVLGSIVGFFVLVGGCAAVLVSGDDTSTDTDKPAASAPKEPAAGGDKAEAKEQAPAEESLVKIEATRTEFTPSILHSGGDFTSVKVKVTNNSDKNVDVNPLYFAVTDTHGTKHPTDALAEDEHQIDTLTLAPGENVTGVITAEGAFEPATVTFEEGLLFGEPIKVDVK